MMNEVYPQIVALDSNDSRSWRALAAWADLLPSRPDADRTDFYRQRDARGAFIEAQLESGAEQRRALYAGLDLRLTIREAADERIVTEEGKQYVREHSPKPPKLSRSAERYRRWLRSGADMPFGDWLREASRG